MLEVIALLHTPALIIHIVGTGSALLLVLIADLYGFKWVRGTTPTLETKTLNRLHAGVWFGLLSTIISGIILLVPVFAEKIVNTAFQFKMLFVLLLCINACVIGHLMTIATESPFSEITTTQRLHLYLSGAVSVSAWATVLGIVYYLNYL